MKVAVIGYGSIGKRHAANIEWLGHEVVIYDPPKGLVAEVHRGIYAHIVATPPAERWYFAKMPTLAEKPIATLVRMRCGELLRRDASAAVGSMAAGSVGHGDIRADAASRTQRARAGPGRSHCRS